MGFISNRGNTVTSYGTSDPASTPSRVGDRYVNTASGAVFVAKGTSASTDWKLELTQS